MALLALGVVYGDIGTSPLYALRECLAHGRFEPVTPESLPRRDPHDPVLHRIIAGLGSGKPPSRVQV